MIEIVDTKDSRAVRNKNNVLELYELMINQKKSAEATAKFLSSAYVQHNPLIPNGSVALGQYFGKAAAFVSYGSAMGARGVQQLRETAIELQMAPVRSSVHIPVATLWAHFQGGDVEKGLAELEKQGSGASVLLECSGQPCSSADRFAVSVAQPVRGALQGSSQFLCISSCGERGLASIGQWFVQTAWVANPGDHRKQT